MGAVYIARVVGHRHWVRLRHTQHCHEVGGCRKMQKGVGGCSSARGVIAPSHTHTHTHTHTHPHTQQGGPAEGEGLETGGCPVYSHPAQLTDNRNCVLCMTCLKVRAVHGVLCVASCAARRGPPSPGPGGPLSDPCRPVP